jgi:large subunit ribosomal protein L24e
MVVKTDLCAFTETRVYPGKGSRFVTRTGALIVLAGSKATAMYHQRKRPALLRWTQVRARGACQRRLRGVQPAHGSIGSSNRLSSPHTPHRRAVLPSHPQAWRRQHKKLNVETGAKKKARRVVKAASRAFVGMSSEELKKKRVAAPKAAAAPAAAGEKVAAKKVVQPSVAEAKAKMKAAAVRARACAAKERVSCRCCRLCPPAGRTTAVSRRRRLSYPTLPTLWYRRSSARRRARAHSRRARRPSPRRTPARAAKRQP